jgi:hypothetical protein
MIYPDIVSTVFCVQFWIGHYRMKQQQFDVSQREIEQEEKKLAAIIAEKEAWQKWDNSTPRVMQKTVKQLEEMGEQLEREFAETHPSSSPKQQPRKQQPTASKTTVAKPISGGYNGVKMSNEADNNNNSDNTQQQPIIKDNESDLEREKKIRDWYDRTKSAVA